MLIMFKGASRYAINTKIYEQLLDMLLLVSINVMPHPPPLTGEVSLPSEKKWTKELLTPAFLAAKRRASR